jgi:hypothetical protein
MVFDRWQIEAGTGALRSVAAVGLRAITPWWDSLFSRSAGRFGSLCTATVGLGVAAP